MRLSGRPSSLLLCVYAAAMAMLFLLAVHVLQFAGLPANLATVHVEGIQQLHWRKAGPTGVGPTDASSSDPTGDSIGMSSPTGAEELSGLAGATGWSGSRGAGSVPSAVPMESGSTGLTGSTGSAFRVSEQREGRNFSSTGSTDSASRYIQISEEQKEGKVSSPTRLTGTGSSLQMSQERKEKEVTTYAEFQVYNEQPIRDGPDYAQLSKLFQSVPKQSDEKLSMNACAVPADGFKAWRQGVVTTLVPKVSVDCSLVIARDEHEMSRVKEAVSHWKNAITDEEMLERVQNCSWFTEYFTNNLFVSGLELSFPIAFTFVVHDSPQQVLRLLRLLYRPHNTYCIHYDSKSEFKDFFQSVARCFDNILISSQVENVVWGYYTIMQAQMNCLSDLLRHRSRASQEYKWKYVINLCGKELPLTTNKEMVSKLIQLKGSSSIITEPCANKKVLIQQRLSHPVMLNQEKTKIVMDKRGSLDDIPFDLSLYHKSSSYNALSFQFSNYLIFNSTAQKLYEFFKKTRNSEEHFYATLYHTPGVPGGYKGYLHHHYFEVAGSFWSKLNTFQKKGYQCHGTVVHKVCIVGAGDLRTIVRYKPGKRLFHNKYFMEYDHTVMGCMEKRIVARNRQEYQLECERGAIG